MSSPTTQKVTTPGELSSCRIEFHGPHLLQSCSMHFLILLSLCLYVCHARAGLFHMNFCSCLVCVSVHGSNLLVAQLRDKLVILTAQYPGRSRMNLAFFVVSKIAIAFPYLRSLIREKGSFSAFLPYTTLVIARVQVNFYAHV